MKSNQQKNQKDECSVSINLPYPPVQAESRSMDYAAAMLSNVGSSNSEMSAVCLYFYNSVILKPEYEDFANCFHRISIVEMHHLDIFATLAYQMGLDPRMWNIEKRGTHYWTPAYDRYPRSIKEVIENSLQGELAAIHKYERQAERIRDNNIVENLHRIILDERHHVEIFYDMLSKLS